MKKLLSLLFIIVATKVQSQTNGSKSREVSLNISIGNKKGKEFYYRSEDRSIFNKECIIVVKKKDPKRSAGISTGFKEIGVFKQGFKNGLWETTYKNKTVKIENWTNGLILGAYKVFNTKGKSLYETVFGKKGISKYKDYYYKTGVLKVEGNYTYGRKVGEWFYYNEKGDKIKTINYIQGVPK